MVRIVQVILSGGLLTGLLLLAVQYFASVNDAGGSSWVGNNSSWWPFFVVTAFILGVIVGAVSSSIIVWFKLAPLQAALFGLTTHVLVSTAIYFIIANGPLSDSFKYPLGSLVPIGLINALVTSYIFCSESSLD